MQGRSSGFTPSPRPILLHTSALCQAVVGLCITRSQVTDSQRQMFLREWKSYVAAWQDGVMEAWAVWLVVHTSQDMISLQETVVGRTSQIRVDVSEKYTREQSQARSSAPNRRQSSTTNRRRAEGAPEQLFQ